MIGKGTCPVARKRDVMRIGILVLSIGDSGQKGFYHTQETGLARELDKLFDEVKVYKLVSVGQKRNSEQIAGCGNASILFLPARKIGNNGLIDTSALDGTLDAMVLFADTQFSVPAVFRWSVKNSVRLLPYIGVTESHSASTLKRTIVDWLFGRNIRVYRKCSCLAKTPAVEQSLKRIGVGDITVTPVGLDITLLKTDYLDTSSAALKRKYDFSEEDRVLLFVGRLTEEKQPLQMVDIFVRLAATDGAFRLLMVGTGGLKDAVKESIHRHGINGKVHMLERVPNRDMWELYRLSEAFINLNRLEIVGMAILEAMYYGCKVIAWKAPGPDFIIEDGVSGWLVSEDSQVIAGILDMRDVSRRAHESVLERFTWETAAQRIRKLLNS